jgi:DHA3 family tetracycline resistance protein-like MFS transporter
VSRPGPYPVYLFISGAFAVFFMLYATIASVYRIQTVGLGPLERATLLFKVPTGAMADTYGRKLSVVVGFLLIGAGFILEGSFPVFAVVLAAQVVWGVGYTFISGALQAWIADETPGQNLGRVYLRGEQADYLGSLVGALASGFLAIYARNLPLLLAGAFTVALGVTLTVVMPERNFRPTPAAGRRSWRRMEHTARGGYRVVRSRPVLLTLLAVTAFAGMSSEGFDRLWEAHFLKNYGLPELGGLDPVVCFGVINAGTLVLGFVAAEILGRVLDVGSGRPGSLRPGHPHRRRGARLRPGRRLRVRAGGFLVCGPRPGARAAALPDVAQSRARARGEGDRHLDEQPGERLRPDRRRTGYRGGGHV